MLSDSGRAQNNKINTSLDQKGPTLYTTTPYEDTVTTIGTIIKDTIQPENPSNGTDKPLKELLQHKNNSSLTPNVLVRTPASPTETTNTGISLTGNIAKAVVSGKLDGVNNVNPHRNTSTTSLAVVSAEVTEVQSQGSDPTGVVFATTLPAPAPEAESTLLVTEDLSPGAQPLILPTSPQNPLSITKTVPSIHSSTLAPTLTPTPVLSPPPASPDTTSSTMSSKEPPTSTPNPSVSSSSTIPLATKKLSAPDPPSSIITSQNLIDEVSEQPYTTENTTMFGVYNPEHGQSSGRIVAIVVPIMIGLLAIAVVLIVLLLYRRRQRHRKANIIKYKRHSQNGEVTIPLTSVCNDNYRSSRVSAHEEAVVYSQVDKTIRPPRPTYRYKTEERIPLNQSVTHQDPEWNSIPANNNTGELDTTIVDNENYSPSPTRADAPKVPMRKSSSDSHGSLKKTPASAKRDISWPIPKGSCSPNGSVTPGSTRSSHYSPPVPPSPRHGPPALRPAPPSPRSVPPIPMSDRPTPSTPPSPHCGLPPPPTSRGDDHEYDPVYVPRSDAEAINRRLDNAGYVTSRRMRMNAANQQPYEDVDVVTNVTSSSMASIGQISSPSASPSRSHGSACMGTGTPSPVRTRTISKSDSDHATGDQSFDTQATENSNKVHFSVEDITKIIDNCADANSEEKSEVEYSDIPGDYEDSATCSSINNNTEMCKSDEENDSTYETVDFK